MRRITFPSSTPISQTKTRMINQIMTYLLLLSGGILIMIPFFWMISTSLKKQWDVYQFPPVWIPDPPQWQNFVYALSVYPFHLYVLNTLRIVVFTCLGTVLSCSL